jgi:hypothetical protein
MRKKVVKTAKRAAMGIDMESILGRIRTKTLNMTEVPTPLLTTRSARDMTLAISRMKVKTNRLTIKVGTVSRRTLNLMMLGRIRTSGEKKRA